MNEINLCDCCKTDIHKWNEVSCFIPQPDKGYGPHPRPNWWGKKHVRVYIKNDGTCIGQMQDGSKCVNRGFPYCEGHDSP